MNSVTSMVDCGCESPKQVESPNLLETFRRKRAQLLERLNNVDAVIAALERNPEINTLLELINKAR